VGHGLAEVGTCVALKTADLIVSPAQFEFRQIVIKTGVGFEVLPTRSHVTGLAISLKSRVLKGATMWIGMAVFTTAVAQADINGRCFPRCGLVAVGARDALVSAGQRIRRTAMIEPLGRLPGILLVAACAIGSQLTLVGVLVAQRTSGWQSQERLI